MSIRARLDEIPAGTELLRQIRYLKAGELDEITVAELTAGARWLRAAAYSARLGAERFDAELRRREQKEEQCSSFSSSTATTGTTADSPKDASSAPGPSSPSKPRTTAEESCSSSTPPRKVRPSTTGRSTGP